jgi:hypothetical protein
MTDRPWSEAPVKDRDPAPLAVRRLGTVACLLSLATGLAYLVSGLFAIHGFAWRQPIFDQLRLYPMYLGLPFPENVLQLENGHRPIIPALLRVAELRWFGGDQGLQILVGALFATAAVTAVWLAALRSPQLGAGRRAAGAGMFGIAVFWFANARMLLHGNESVHAYLVALMAVLATALVWRSAGRRDGLASLLLAMACGIVATCSFGPGVAVPCLVVVLALLFGAGWRNALTAAICGFVLLFAYTHWLPGADGVRASITVRGVDNLRVMALWMNSPWVSLGLGALAPAFAPEAANALAGTWVAAPWSLLARRLGPEAGYGLLLLICSALGLFAVLATLRGSVLLRRTRRDLASPLFAMGIGLAWFGLGVTVLISLSRLTYFDAYPGQILADRYLVWPCLLWAGVFLQWVAAPDAPRDRRRGAVACALVVAIGLAAWPAHRHGMQWGSAVYAIAERSAVAAWMGIEDPEWLVDDGASSLADKRRSVLLFRQHRVAMFSRDADRLMGQHVDPVPADPAAPPGRCTITRTFVDPPSGRTFFQFRGFVTDASLPHPAGAELVAVDARQTIVGLATWTHYSAPDGTAPRWWAMRRNGFDGYAPATGSEPVEVALVTPKGIRSVCTMAADRGPVRN